MGNFWKVLVQEIDVQSFKRSLLALVLMSLNVYGLESEKKIVNVEGKYQICSVEEVHGYTRVRFEKYPSSKESKDILIELSSINPNLMQKGIVLDLTAQILEETKDVIEAEQVLLIFPRHNAKTSVWFLSRKAKLVNFSNASFLKMHGSENDYLIL